MSRTDGDPGDRFRDPEGAGGDRHEDESSGERDGESDQFAEAEPAEPAEDAEDAEDAYELLQRGHALLRKRHNAQAAIVLERAARIEQGKGSILEALARAYYNSGQPERAVEAFEALLAVDPSAHYGHFGLGLSLKRLGRQTEARTHLRLAVALHPESTLYRNALARLDAAARET